MSTGLAVASGIARGAAAFSQAFQQARLQKFQMKQRKNDRLAEMLLARAADPHTKFHERASIINEYQKLYDPKPEERLSTLLGYDKLNERDFDTGQVKTANVNPDIPEVVDGKVQAGTPAPENQDLARGTETPIIKKYGDMTPAQVHAKLQLDLEKARDKGELKKAKELARYQFDLQEKSYKANGYKVTGEGMVDGEYVQVLTNAAGDQKTNRMPKGFKPIKLEIAENSANKPSTFIKERVAYHIANGKSEGEAEFLALKDSNDKFILKKKTGEAYVEGINAKNAGTGPPRSPGQVIDDSREERKQIATYKANINRAKSETIRAGELAGSTAELATNHWKNVVEPIKAEMQKWLDGGKKTTDPEYTQREARLNTEIDRYTDLKNTADRTKATFESLQGAQKEAEDILTEYTSGNTGSSTNSSFNPRQKAMIAHVRKANGKAATNLSDEQIAAQILADPVRSKKFK